MKLLLVEDNKSISDALSYTLESKKYNVVVTDSVESTLSVLKKETFDLLILDVSLPDGNGFDLFKKIKEEYNYPTIFLTACDLEEDIVKGLLLGAEDYITKPFKTLELLVRIEKILLRNKIDNIIVDDIKYDIEKNLFYKNDTEILLTPLELKILGLLFDNIGKVVTRDYIIEKIWEWTGNDVNDNTITVYLKRIREKIDSDIIKTIKGIGYRIDEK